VQVRDNLFINCSTSGRDAKNVEDVRLVVFIRLAAMTLYRERNCIFDRPACVRRFPFPAEHFALWFLFAPRFGRSFFVRVRWHDRQ
jgi:hypothetical protein